MEKNSAGLKLWSLSGEVTEKTDKLQDVRNRLHNVFSQNAEQARHQLSGEYWHQVENQVQHEQLQNEVAKSAQ